MMSIVLEILDELKAGVSTQELALRYSIAKCTIRNYATGRRFGLPTGRPPKLSKTQQSVICKTYTAGEATVLELAAIYRVPPMNIRRVLARHSVKPLGKYTRRA